MKTAIYYFTGTGNSLEVARDIHQKLSDSHFVSITALLDMEAIIPQSQIVGMVFPVHDWNLPCVVRNFVEKLELDSVTYIFAVANCNFLAGGTLDHLDRLLKEKGHSLTAGFVIRMPGTYLPLYGPNPERMQQQKFRRKDRDIDKIIRIVSTNRPYKIEYKGIFVDKWLSPLFRQDSAEIRRSDANFHVDGDKCTGCGICTKVCAFKSIELVDGKPQWQHRCQRCFACIHLCPRMAIQYGNHTEKKKRYKNPNVTLQEIISSNKQM
ncbi:MAG TPA: EFR1 family ferrodoxin [Bacillota bacterium]